MAKLQSWAKSAINEHFFLQSYNYTITLFKRKTIISEFLWELNNPIFVQIWISFHTIILSAKFGLIVSMYFLVDIKIHIDVKLIKIPEVLQKKMCIFCQSVFTYCSITFTWHFVWTNLSPFNLRILDSKSGGNRLCGSREEDKNVKRYSGQTERLTEKPWTTGDQKNFLELHHFH